MFNSRLTVGDCRTAGLARYIRPGADLIEALNQVCERYTYNAKNKGNVVRVTIDSSPGFITLPAPYLSVLGSTFNHWPMPIFGEFHTYFESGPGTPWEAAGWLGQLQDMGDGFCSQADIIQANTEVSPAIVAQPGAILIYSTGSDNGKTVRLEGIETETGLPIVGPTGIPGEVITLNAPFVASTKHYSKLTDVIKEATNGPVTAWVKPMSGAANYQIASWLPQETRPRYRRYYTGTATKAIQILAQRRFLMMQYETSWVLPDSLAALKFGLKALTQEDTGYETKALENWDTGFKWLDDASTASRGGAQPSVPAGVWGWMEPIAQQH